MSRFLRKRRMAWGLLFVIAVLLVFTNLWIISIALLLGLMIIFLNRCVIHRINHPMYAFHSNREIKHYGILVIGDMISTKDLAPYIDKQQNVLSIMASDRCLEASWQILRHSVSILDEGDTCVIVDRGKKSSKKPYTIFDVPFLHQITRMELHIDESYYKKVRFPLLYEPIRSLRTLYVWGGRYQLSTCPHDAIVRFCHKKNIRLIYLYKA